MFDCLRQGSIMLAERTHRLVGLCEEAESDPDLSAQRRPGCNWLSLASLVTPLLSPLKVVATFLENSNA